MRPFLGRSKRVGAGLAVVLRKSANSPNLRGLQPLRPWETGIQSPSGISCSRYQAACPWRDCRRCSSNCASCSWNLQLSPVPCCTEVDPHPSQQATSSSVSPRKVSSKSGIHSLPRIGTVRRTEGRPTAGKPSCSLWHSRTLAHR